MNMREIEIGRSLETCEMEKNKVSRFQENSRENLRGRRRRNCELNKEGKRYGDGA